MQDVKYYMVGIITPKPGDKTVTIDTCSDFNMIMR
jgi:hypothetical protein